MWLGWSGVVKRLWIGALPQQLKLPWHVSTCPNFSLHCSQLALLSPSAPTVLWNQRTVMRRWQCSCNRSWTEKRCKPRQLIWWMEVSSSVISATRTWHTWHLRGGHSMWTGVHNICVSLCYCKDPRRIFEWKYDKYANLLRVHVSRILLVKTKHRFNLLRIMVGNIIFLTRTF